MIYFKFIDGDDTAVTAGEKLDFVLGCVHCMVMFLSQGTFHDTHWIVTHRITHVCIHPLFCAQDRLTIVAH